MQLYPTPLLIDQFLSQLRKKIITAFEEIDGGSFERTRWNHAEQGGGEMAVLRGAVFEKAAVNFSAVSGSKFPMNDSAGAYFATGISLITHMTNPHAPTVHMNLRYIETEKESWFGGGYDLTPMGFPYPEDTAHFHSIPKRILSEELYERFSKQAAEYFYIPHWKKERGVGGIFFDHFHTNNFEADFALWQEIGDSFLETILPIYSRRISTPYTPEEKKLQLRMRAHYAEFNLLYDRGTKFGFLSNGNPHAILCSMPPLASW